MIKDVLNIVYLYLNIDKYYKIKDKFQLCVTHYCKNVKNITCQSWINFTFRKNKINWASSENYLEVVKYLHSIGQDCTTEAMDNASRLNHLEVVKYLHSIGKNVYN